MEIKGFDPRDLKMCHVATLADLGYRTTVTVANGFTGGRVPRDDVDVSLEVRDPDGGAIFARDLMSIVPGECAVVDLSRELDLQGVETSCDVLATIRLGPARYRGVDAIDVSAAEVIGHVSVSDEYVEYSSERWNVASGLAYQSHPVNDSRFGGTRSTLMQSPKVLVDDDLDTHLLLLNVSTEPGYDRSLAFDLALLAADGVRLATVEILVPPNGFRRLSMRDLLRSEGALERFVDLGGFGMAVGSSVSGTIVPISVTRSDRSKGLACDHTLPPIYYLPWWGGEIKKAANTRLRAVLFGRKQPELLS